MTPLYFRAVERPRAAEALRIQVRNSLWPYAEYLRSAIASAKRRESRSVCRWDIVPRQFRLRLDPLDTLLVVEADGHRYAGEGGPDDPPDKKPLFAGDEYRPISPRRVERIAGRTFVVLESVIDEGEWYFWGDRKYALIFQAEWSREPVTPRRDCGAAYNSSVDMNGDSVYLNFSFYSLNYIICLQGSSTALGIRRLGSL